MNIKTIITAGGTSSRFGKSNKLLKKLNGKEVIKHTVEKFLAINEISEIIICANASIIDILNKYFNTEPKVSVIEGGSTRQQSVYNGLQHAEQCDYVIIHDGARPLVSEETILKTIELVKEKKAVSVMTKTTDTIKEVDETGKVIRTIDRSKLYNTQTPQAFDYKLIKDIHEKLIGKSFTDDAGMAEELGCDVYILENDYKNIKITTQNDMDIATIYLNNSIWR